MKHFSVLIAFAMIFAFLSTAYADIAPYPRPRPHSDSATQIVEAKITADNELLLKFLFPAACDYEYKIRDVDSEEIVKSGEGFYETDETLTEIVDLVNLQLGERKYYEVTVRMCNLREQTRFGEKVTNSVREVINTVLVKKDKQGNNSVIRVYKGGFY